MSAPDGHLRKFGFRLGAKSLISDLKPELVITGSSLSETANCTPLCVNRISSRIIEKMPSASGGVGGIGYRYPIIGTGFSFQLKSGRTSAPRLPQAVQTKCGSRSESLVIGPCVTVDRQRVAAAIVRAVDQQPAHTAVAHLGKGDLHGAIGHRP